MLLVTLIIDRLLKYKGFETEKTTKKTSVIERGNFQQHNLINNLIVYNNQSKITTGLTFIVYQSYK